MLVVAMHSIELLRPFLPADAMTKPFWRSWVLHVEILSCILKPSFTYPELLRLQDTIVEWHTQFHLVPEYKGFWVPKFHWAMHLPLDIWRFGPPRLNWCMTYEAKNQPLKRGCKRSNFKNAPKATAEFWCDSTDFHLQRQRGVHKRLSVVPGAVTASGPASSFPLLVKETAHMASQIPHDSEIIYAWLDSATYNNQEMNVGSFCEIEICEVRYLAKIESLVVISNEVYVWLLAYPAEATYSYDQNGVLQVSAAALEESKGTRAFVSVASHNLAMYWHFCQEDGSTTFIAKW